MTTPQIPPLPVTVMPPTSARAVALRCGGDETHATELRRLIRDAEDGVRRIAVAGAKIEWLVTELPHGGLEPWMERWLPDVTTRTVRRWREFARMIFQAAGALHPAEVGITLPPHHLISLPVEQLPENARAFREKIDEVMDGRTYRQLCFAFKQVDGTGRAAPGRRAGEKQAPGHRLTPEERVEVEEREYLYQLNELKLAITLVDSMPIHHTGLRRETVQAHRLEIEAVLGKAIDLNHKLRELLADASSPVPAGKGRAVTRKERA